MEKKAAAVTLLSSLTSASVLTVMTYCDREPTSYSEMPPNPSLLIKM